MATHSELLYPSSRPGTPPSSPSTQDTPSKKTLPDRERRVPEKAQPFKAELAKQVQARNDRQTTQKRKAEAEARPNSKPPGPIIDHPSKRHKAESSKHLDDSILSVSFDDLTTDSDRMIWYRAAIRRRHGMDVDIGQFGLAELKEMFDDPEVAHDEITHSDDEMMRVVPAGNDEDGSPPGRSGSTNTPTPDHHVTPLSRVDSSDYTTIMPGVPPNPKRGRDANGNRLPLTPSKAPAKGKQKAVPRPVSLSGTQHRPKGAAPPPRFQETGSASSNAAGATSSSAGSPHTPATTTPKVPPVTPSTPSKPPKSSATIPAKPSTAAPAKPSAKPAGPSTAPAKPSTTSAKPSPTTPAKSSITTSTNSPATPTARSKPSVSTPGRHTATSSNAGGSTHTPTSGSGSRSQPRKPPANEPKPSKTGSSRSAKHLKTRHKGGRRDKPSRDEEETQPEEDSDGDTEEGQATKAEDEISMRQAAQLNKFGDLRWLVKAVSVRIKLRALKENPYADFTKPPPDEDGDMQPSGYILDGWLDTEWKRVWLRRFPNEPIPKMKQEHVKWLYERFSGIRNEAKNAVGDRTDMYGLSRNKTKEQNKAIVESLGLDGFLSPTLTRNDPLAFHHRIFEISFRKAYFSRAGSSYGYQYARHFQPMPMGVYGLFATIIYVLIQEFQTGEQVPSTLNAEDQLPWYNMFIEIYKTIDNNTSQEFLNKRMETFDLCYGLNHTRPTPRIEAPPREFPPDTQTVYVSRVRLPHGESDDEMSPEPEVIKAQDLDLSGANPATPPGSLSRSQSPEPITIELDVFGSHEPSEDGEAQSPSGRPVEELVCVSDVEGDY